MDSLNHFFFITSQFNLPNTGHVLDKSQSKTLDTTGWKHSSSQRRVHNHLYVDAVYVVFDFCATR